MGMCVPVVGVREIAMDVVFVKMFVVSMVMPASAERIDKALPEHRQSDVENQKSGSKAQHRHQSFGQNELRREKCDKTKSEHADRVRDGDRQPEQSRMFRSSLRTYKISANDRLPVPRGHRMHRSKPERYQKAD